MNNARFWATLLLGWANSSAYALDHKNLDEGRPLRLADPYAIAQGEIAVEGGVGYNSENQGSSRGVFPIQILYGALPNSHFELGTTLLTNPRSVTGPSKSGDLTLSGLYNFNQETLHVPALGIKLTTTLPTGIDSTRTEVEIQGLVAKSFANLGLYLNASHVFVSGSGQAGNDRNDLLLGATYPVGAPLYTRLTLAADVFAELSRGLLGTELGLRYQFAQRIVLDAGAGSELSGPADRALFVLRVGASVGI